MKFRPFIVVKNSFIYNDRLLRPSWAPLVRYPASTPVARGSMGIILICDNLCMIWIYPLKTQDASGKWRFSSRIPTKHVIMLGVTVTGWGVDPIIWWGFYAHHIRFGSFDSKRGGLSESFEGGLEARDVQNAWQTAQGFLRTSSLWV